MGYSEFSWGLYVLTTCTLGTRTSAVCEELSHLFESVHVGPKDLVEPLRHLHSTTRTHAQHDGSSARGALDAQRGQCLKRAASLSETSRAENLRCCEISIACTPRRAPTDESNWHKRSTETERMRCMAR